MAEVLVRSPPGLRPALSIATHEEGVYREADVKDHARILGGLYMAWAVFQTLSAVVLLVAGGTPAQGAAFWVFAAVTLLLLVAYALTGRRLWAHDLRARPIAVALAVVALLSFPVGTALGVYALWALFRRVVPAAART